MTLLHIHSMVNHLDMYNFLLLLYMLFLLLYLLESEMLILLIFHFYLNSLYNLK